MSRVRSRIRVRRPKVTFKLPEESPAFITSMQSAIMVMAVLWVGLMFCIMMR